MADAPIGGRSFGDPIKFSELQNRNPIDSLRTHNRFDPYWDGLWAQGTSAVWMDHARATRQVAAGLGRLPAQMTADPETALDNRLTDREREGTLDVLGVMDTWRTATAQQLAAITGDRRIATGSSRIMREMFACGLTDVGNLSNGLLASASASSTRLYRPSRTRVFDEKVRDAITYPEWVSVTGGTDFESGRQFDRHNLLATEVGLRFAEYTDAATLLGEKLSSFELLGHTGIGFPTPDRFYQRSGDIVIVREDGARIVIELTASRSSDFGEKVRRWARLLSDRRMAKSGLAVVFLSASHPDGSPNHRWNVRNGIYREVAAAVREFPGVSFDRVASRIGVADWREWFPEPGAVSSSFLTMDVDRASGEPASPWERASFLDIFDLEFNPDEPERFTSVIDNASMLRGTPRWMREGCTTPDLTAAMHARSDYAHLSLESLQKGRSDKQREWFNAPRPPERLRG